MDYTQKKNKTSNKEIGSTAPRNHRSIAASKSKTVDTADAEDIHMADALGETEQLSQDPPKVDRSKGRANADDDEYNDTDSESDEDYEPDADDVAAELPGLEPYKPRHKKTADDENPAAEDSEDDINLGDYEELHFGKDFVVIDGEHVHMNRAFGDEYVKRIVRFWLSHIKNLVLTFA